MSQEIPNSRYSVPRTRRVYSTQFKAELIAACQQVGASIAATAREHGMNANVLHRWLKEHRQCLHQSACDTTHAVACGIEDAAAEPVVDAHVCTPAHQAHPVLASPLPAFIAMTLGSPVMEPQPAGAKAAPSAASAAPSSDIRIECCHHGTLVTVNWPLGAAAECSRALQGLLQVLRQ